MGYTPLFDTLLSGTLYSRWPHTGVWACLLSRVSREGLIDETPQALATAIGIPLDEFNRCIADFMQPDPQSRSREEDGRRLVLIDESRAWGWRVVNHSKYKEKARKRAYDEQRTSSGADAERKRRERASDHTDPTCPDASRRVPLSSPSPSPTPEREARTRDDDRPDGSREMDTRGTMSAGNALTRMPTAEDALTEVLNAWRDVRDCDPDAMTAWLTYWPRVHAGREMPGHQRIATAKLMAGLGDASTQRRAVRTAEANGWKSLRHGDGRDTRPANLRGEDPSIKAERELREWRDLEARAERVGFRKRTDLDDLCGYRTLVEREENKRPASAKPRGPHPIGALVRAS